MYKLTIELFVLVSIIASANAEDQSDGRKYALLVGVQKYDNTGLRKLEFCENDVTDLAEVLRSDGMDFHVTLLTRTESQSTKRDELLPTASNIRAYLKSILKDRRAQDTVLLAFAGHGVQLKADNKMYFCPLLCDLSAPDTLISIDDIYAELGKCNALAKVLLVDACRTDPADSEQTSRDVLSVTRPLIPDPPGGAVALFSCSKGQTAREKNGHGYLFRFVVEGLKGNTHTINERTDEVSWLKLAAYVSDEVRDAVRDDYGPLVTQNPEVKGESRNLVLGKRSKEDPNDLMLDLGEGVKIQLVRVKGGLAQYNTAFKYTELKVKEDFFMGKYPTTVAQFKRFVAATAYETSAERSKQEKSWREPGFDQTDSHPVVFVSPEDCFKFTQWASTQTRRNMRIAKFDEFYYAAGDVKSSEGKLNLVKNISNEGGTTAVANSEPHWCQVFGLQSCNQWVVAGDPQKVEHIRSLNRGISFVSSASQEKLSQEGAGFRVVVPIP